MQKIGDERNGVVTGGYGLEEMNWKRTGSWRTVVYLNVQPRQYITAALNCGYATWLVDGLVYKYGIDYFSGYD